MDFGMTMTVSTFCCFVYLAGFGHGWARGRRWSDPSNPWPSRTLRNGKVNPKPAGPTPPLPVQVPKVQR